MERRNTKQPVIVGDAKQNFEQRHTAFVKKVSEPQQVNEYTYLPRIGILPINRPPTGI